MSFAQGGRARVEVYIEANKALFDRLQARREELEEAFGEALSWERLDDRQASRIAVYCAGSIDASAEDLKLIHVWSVERLLKIRDVLGPVVRQELQLV
jgi:Domain of unknown function (DUF4268)